MKIIQKIAESAKGKKWLTLIATVLVVVELFGPALREQIYEAVPEAEEAVDARVDELTPILDAMDSMREQQAAIQTNQVTLASRVSALDTSVSALQSADTPDSPQPAVGSPDPNIQALADSVRTLVDRVDALTTTDSRPTDEVREVREVSPMEVRAQAHRDQQVQAQAIFSNWQQSSAENRKAALAASVEQARLNAAVEASREDR